MDASSSDPTFLSVPQRRDMWELSSAVLSNVFLFFLIFGLSATVDYNCLKERLENRFAILTGITMQFLIMPLLGYAAVNICQRYGLTEAMGITLLVVTASPGGSYSNWWCSLFNADLALSVAMTTVSSVLSIALLPLNLFVYTYLAYGTAENERGESIIQALDFETIFITLGIVLSAIVLGLYTGYRYDTPTAHQRANKLGSICGLLLVIFSIVLSNGGDTKLWSFQWSFYIAVAAPCVIGVAVATLLARSVRLSPPETVAISIECCYQNTGIATSVAITMFSNAEERAQAVAVPLFYGIVEAVVIGLYCVHCWKIGWTKAPANERLCTVLTKSYEIVPTSDGDDDDDNDEGNETPEPEENESDEEEAVLPPEQAQSQQPRPGFFRRILLGRKRQRPETNSFLLDDDDNDSKKPQRKRIVSDFTAETTLSLTSDAQLPLESPHLPIQSTILEGACEASEHVEDLADDDEEEEDQVVPLNESHESSA